MSKIFIVEDDINIAEIEEFALKGVGYDVAIFGDGMSFFEALKEETPQLVILDVMLPDKDGLTIVKELRQMPSTAKLPVIMVTAKSSEIDKVKGLDNGADDYITKPFGVMELISRVKAILRRINPEMDNQIIKYEGIVLDDAKHQVLVEGKDCELTYKEYQLLKLLIQNSGIVLQRSRILDRVWGTDFEGESRTLDMHIKTLRQKLGSKGELIKTVRNVGYTLK